MYGIDKKERADLINRYTLISIACTVIVIFRIVFYLIEFYRCEGLIKDYNMHESDMTLIVKINKIVDYEHKNYRIFFKVFDSKSLKCELLKNMNGYLDLKVDQYLELYDSLTEKYDIVESLQYKELIITGNFKEMIVKSNPGEQEPIFKYLGYRTLGKFNYNNVILHIDPKLENNKNFKQESDLYSKLMKVQNAISTRLSDRVERIYHQPLQGLVIAMVLGNRDYLDDTLSDLYKEQGLLHMIAISGLHISFLFFCIEYLQKIWIRSQPLRLLFSLICLCLYVFLLGFNVSALRATTMILFFHFSIAFHQPFSSIRSFFLTAVIYLTIFPHILFQVGFILSYAAVFAVIVISPIIKDLFRVVTIKRHLINLNKEETLLSVLLNSLRDLFIVNLAVNIMLFPILSYFFGGISITGIFANLLILPSMSIFYIFMVLSVFTFPCNSIPNIIFTFFVKSLYGYISLICELLNEVPNHYRLLSRPSILFVLLYYLTLTIMINQLLIIRKRYDSENAI